MNIENAEQVAWSAWMPLLAAHPLALQQLPEAPGIFRIRRERGHEILCTESADSGVRVAVERLARQVRLSDPPNPADPLATRLWEEHRRTGGAFQVSGAAVRRDGTG